MTDEIVYEVSDPVAVVTLNRPATLNALTHSMLGSFRDAVDEAARDPRVVGIVGLVHQVVGADDLLATALVEKRPASFPRLGNG